MQPLDLPNTPLDGRHLIEASAGTGKTYAITALYVRLLVERGLRPDAILVVTYTEAACAELKERIRARVSQAADAMDRGRSDDPFLAALLARYRRQGRDPAAVADSLALALLDFDLAAISTIHGFCRRVLMDSAFESGYLFDAEFIEDDTPLLREVIDDYWRRATVDWHPLFAAYVVDRGWTPDVFLSSMRGLLAPLRGHGPRILHFPPWCSPRDFDGGLADACMDLWRAEGAAVRSLLDNSAALKRGRTNRHAYHPERLARLYTALDAWCRGDWNAAAAEAVNAFSESSLADNCYRRKRDEVPAHPFFTACRRVCDALAAAGHGLRRELILAAGRALAASKEAKGLLSFDDLLTGVRDGLRRGGPDGELARRIADRFPAALIDEFQDTDPVQFEIFDTVYGRGPGRALFMVGDPKQAIYAFRGADVFSYLQAAAIPGARCHTLDTNWRSEGGLIRACNHLFSRSRPFVLRDIAFHPVRAPEDGGRRLFVGGSRAAPFTLCVFPDQPGRDEAGRIAAQSAAAMIRDLLVRAAAGDAVLVGADGGTALTAGDIAVLVRRHRDGEMMRRALDDLGVHAVIGARRSVWRTKEAAELCAVLRAVTAPADMTAMRTALATDILGADAGRLRDFGQGDAPGFEERVGEYLAIWREQGPAPMIFRLMAREEAWTRIVAARGGERGLTNLRHLTELLQEAARRDALSPEALVDWFQRQRLATTAPDAALVRLESDESLVRIVTVHASKGLQYPVVFCPFFWDSAFLGGRGRDDYVLCHEQGGVVADFGTTLFTRRRERAAREAFAEEMRLLYVALTRAESRCLVLWGRARSGRRWACDSSPLGYLLWRGTGSGEEKMPLPGVPLGDLDNDGHRELLRAVCADGGIALEEAQGPATPAPLPVPRADRTLLPPREFRRVLEGEGGVRSFSSLRQQEAGGLHGPDGRGTDALALPGAVLAAEPQADADGADIFAFPRGARAGSCLHAIFERLDFQETDQAAIGRLVREQLILHGIDTAWGPVVEDMLAEVTGMRLGPSGPRLRDIPSGRRLDEMEFYYTVPGIADSGLRDLFAAAIRGEKPPPRRPGAVSFMKGFIDLVFEWRGRFYIVDYKSNHLGGAVEDYDGDALAAAMAAAGYDMQYHIYAVALHRYLGRRLPGYEYERHMGGVFYLFVRGMRRGSGHRYGVYAARPEAAAVKALDRCLGREDQSDDG